MNILKDILNLVKNNKKIFIASGSILIVAVASYYIYRKIKNMSNEEVINIIGKDNFNKIQNLHPIIRKKALEIIIQARENDILLNYDVTLRSFEKQKELYGAGRTDTLNSYHNYGLAIDINSTQLTKQEIEEVASLFKEKGFNWGGDWTAYKEVWHFEWKNKTKKELQALLNAGKIDKNKYVII